MNETVWITGAGSGIGAAMARGFAGAGYAVALTGRGREALEEVAASLPSGARAHIAPCDVADRGAVNAAAAEIAEWGGGIHVLCNNAGLNIKKRSWADPDQDAWDDVIRVNVTGALNVIHASLPVMRAQGGGVMIHTSSWAGRFHSKVAGVAYGASKHALSDISASLNEQEGVNGVRSTALCPGEVATPLLAKRPSYDQAKMATIIQPEDMAETALYVARMNPNVAIHEIVLGPVRR